MTPFEKITGDLDWRETELAALRILLANDGLTEGQKLILFRASWTMLYAHYDGFCKFALTVYFRALEASGLKYSEFPPKTQAFALTGKLKEIRKREDVEFLLAMRDFKGDVLDKPITFSEKVDTKSNLWPTTLTGLLEAADLEIKSLQNHNHTLANLVNRRNKITHGERDIIQGFGYYSPCETAVKEIMGDLAEAIGKKIS